MAGNGRVLCFSQIQFLLHHNFSEDGTGKLLTNCLRWLSACSTTMVHILGIGFEKSIHQDIVSSLRRLSYDCEFASEKRVVVSALKSYNVLLIPSEIDLSNDELFEAIVAFATDGGGVSVFFNATQITSMTVPINRLLLKFNLAFTLFVLEEEAEPSTPFPVPDSYTQIRDVNLVPLLARFKATVKQSSVDEQALDDIVQSLRCYVMVCDDSRSDELEQLTEYSWDFLNRTGYLTPSGVCPNGTHCLVALLLFDLSMKLPADKVRPFPVAERFPGPTPQNIPTPPVELTLQLELETWRSTGLWLPAGAVGVVECDEPQPDINVQVGSHQEGLLGKPGPWLRWPFVVMLRPLDARRTQIASPFGGIVYLHVSLVVQEPPPPLRVRFEGFMRHPIADASDPPAWQRTHDVPLPWGEVVTAGAIFTLPSKYIKRLDVALIDEKFRVIVEGIRRYIGVASQAAYRLVFDVELPPDGTWARYPLVFLVDEIDGIMNSFEEATGELFRAVTLMCVGSIREGCLDDQTETAVATIATCVIFETLFAKFDPMELAGISLPPTLFNELWEIQQKDPKVIPATVAKFQGPDWPTSDVPDDMWISFVRELCKVGGKDFTKLLERAKPIPLNISQSLQGLPQFQPEEGA